LREFETAADNISEIDQFLKPAWDKAHYIEKACILFLNPRSFAWFADRRFMESPAIL
jgi:hypothetical protein